MSTPDPLPRTARMRELAGQGMDFGGLLDEYEKLERELNRLKASGQRRVSFRRKSVLPVFMSRPAPADDPLYPEGP